MKSFDVLYQTHKTEREGFRVAKLAKSYGIYNHAGIKVAEVGRSASVEVHSDRYFEMAKLCADAIATKFQL
jgi:hypothetical protein